MNMRSFYKIMCVIGFLLLGCSFVFANQFDAWQKQMLITFDGYTKSETLNNFPALIVFEETSAGAGFYYSDFLSSPYGDLRFASEDKTTPLDFEVEAWNQSGKSYVWVKIPELKQTTKIFMLWGKSEETLPVSSTDGSVWSEHFTGIWHLNETSGTSVKDSKNNQHPGTIMGTKVTVGEPGVIGKAFRFAGNTGYVRTELVHGTTVTISAWATRDADGGMMWARAQYNPDLWFYGGRIILNSGDSQNNPFGNQPANFGDWHHYVTVLDSTQSKARLYIDGELSSNSANYKNPSGVPPFCISSGCGYDWSGTIDEFSTASIARSDDWIWACWENQRVGGNLVAYGNPEMQDFPSVTNARGATNVTANSAWLNGYLASTGTSATAVSVYWGASDGGKNSGSWGNSYTWPSPQLPGAFTKEISGLNGNSTYFYRFKGENVAGEQWANETSVLITGEVNIQKISDAKETGEVPGKFRITRVSGTTSKALTVYYTVGGTATPGDDYVQLSGKVIIPAGSASVDIEVKPFYDHFLEGNETVILTLDDGPFIPGSPSSATVIIEDFGAVVRTWTGNVSTNVNVSENWAEGIVPVAGDHIILNSGANPMHWDLNSPVGAWIQDGYTGTVTINTVYPGIGAFTNFVIVGDCVINTGTWTHRKNTATPQFLIKATVHGDLTIGENATIDVTNNGYPNYTGPGRGDSGSASAGYGGVGWGNGPCYGSITEPTDLG
ncbi:MAG: DUF2341 domain-containing protein, partial [Lentisphaerae bacterium]|nr:DUF2341 domain-containing protein [Lentisphaerota bacterium]